MASESDIQHAFRVLGGLYADEHSEGDTKGAKQVHKLLSKLRKFKAHEADEHAPGPAGWAGGDRS